MKLTIERPGRWTLFLYGAGFFLAFLAVGLMRWAPGQWPPVRLQQMLIAGAILVCLGSVISVARQIRRFFAGGSKNTQ